MKKCICFAAFMITIGLLSAQTNKGRILIGASSAFNVIGDGGETIGLGYSSIKEKSDADGFEEQDPDKRLSVNLSPKIGYFIMNNLALGVDLNAAFTNHVYGYDGDKHKQTQISAGPMVRYYLPISKLLPFVEVGGSYGSVSSVYKFNNSIRDDFEEKGSLMSFGGGLGFAAPLGEKVTFDVLANYTSLTYTSKDDNDDNERTNFGTLGLKIGLSIFFGSK